MFASSSELTPSDRRRDAAARLEWRTARRAEIGGSGGVSAATASLGCCGEVTEESASMPVV